MRRGLRLALALNLSIALGAALVTSAALAVCVDPPTGLVGWWGGDGNAGDVFGTHDGTLAGDTTYAAGQVNQAFSFEGSGDFVSLPNADRWDFGLGSFSINAWFNSSVAGYRNLVRYDNGSSAGYWGVRFEPSGRIQLLVADVAGSATERAITSTDVVSDGAWHMVTAVRDATAGELRLYMDGATAATPVSDGGVNVIGAVDAFPAIGALAYPGGGSIEAFAGLVDEIQVFEGALSTAAAQALFTAGADGACRPCTALPADGLAWWRAEDSTVDEISALDGTLLGGATYADGKVGRAFSFDGSNDVVELPDSPVWDFGTGSFSLAAWFRLQPAAGYPATILAYHEGYGAGTWSLRFPSAGIVQFTITGQSGPSGHREIASVDRFDDGGWHLVVGVRDATAGEMRLFVDGRAAALPVAEPGFNQVGSASNRAAIGAGLWGGGGTFQPFTGEIDEPMVFNRALGESEIRLLANADASGACTACTDPPLDLVSWWQAEDSAADSAGSNDGIAVNGATYADGLVGRAFGFAASDDYIEVADDPSLRFATDAPMSIAFWAYRTSPPPLMGHHLLGKRSSCGAEPFNYQIVFDPPSGGICFSANSGNPVTICSSGGEGDLPIGAWTHFVATADGTAVRLYIDGREVASSPGTLGTPDGAPLRLGTSGCAGDYGYDFGGLLDEVAIYARALERDEVAAVYNAGSYGKCPLDGEPDPFVFTDQTGVGLGTTATSDAVLVGGINTGATISVAACTSTTCEYSIDGGGWTSSAGTVTEGASVQVRQTSSSAYGTTTDLTLDIGGVSDSFGVTTLLQHTLFLTLAGDGSGSVTSIPAGIDCPAASCSAAFPATDTVSLSPVPEPGSVFGGFTGDADCADGSVAMTVDVACTASFLDNTVVFIDGFEGGVLPGPWSGAVP